MPEEYVALTKETALAWRETIAKAKQFLSQQEGRGGSASDIVHGVPVELDGWLHPGLTATAYILSWDETGKEWTKTETSVKVADSLGSISPLPPGTRGLIYPAGENVHILVPFAELQRVRLTSALSPCGVASGELTYVHEGQWQAITIYCYDPLGVTPKEGVPAGQCVWAVYKHDMYRWEVVSWGTCCQEESSSESESSASEEAGCGGVTEDVLVLTAVPTRSGNNIILPAKKLEFVGGCLKSVENMPDYSVYLCCDESDDSISDESSSSEESSSSAASSSSSSSSKICGHCESTPYQMEVTIGGVENNACESCTLFNGTHILTQDQDDPCIYRKTFSPHICGTDEYPDTLTLIFEGNYRCAVYLNISGTAYYTSWSSYVYVDCTEVDQDFTLESYTYNYDYPCTTQNATCHVRSL